MQLSDSILLACLRARKFNTGAVLPKSDVRMRGLCSSKTVNAARSILKIVLCCSPASDHPAPPSLYAGADLGGS